MKNFSEVDQVGKKIGEHESGWVYEYDHGAYLTTGAFTLKVDLAGRFYFQARFPENGITEVDIGDVRPVLDFINKYRYGYKPDEQEDI